MWTAQAGRVSVLKSKFSVRTIPEDSYHITMSPCKIYVCIYSHPSSPSRSKRQFLAIQWWFTFSDWWFGCHFFYFCICWVANHPNWRTHIFQRGGPTTNQYMYIVHVYKCWWNPFPPPKRSSKCWDEWQLYIGWFPRPIIKRLKGLPQTIGKP